MATPQRIVEFWIGEVGPSGWYQSDAALDARIAAEFGETWEAARRGAFDGWFHQPEGALALLILLDQFPRNMFRDDARAFATDAQALALAKRSIGEGVDFRTREPERQFFYLPLMHSESIADQDRCVRLMLTRMPRTGAENLPHARAHREVIRRFGRFPYRNEALGRVSTPAERAWLDAGGYSA